MEVLSDILLAAGVVLIIVAKTGKARDGGAHSWREIMQVVGIAFITIALVERAPDFARWFISGWNAYH